MHTIEAAGDEKPTHVEGAEGVLGEVGRRNVPRQGASAMVIEVGLHVGVAAPSPGGGGVRAGTTQHRAEDTSAACNRPPPSQARRIGHAQDQAQDEKPRRNEYPGLANLASVEGGAAGPSCDVGPQRDARVACACVVVAQATARGQVHGQEYEAVAPK